MSSQSMRANEGDIVMVPVITRWVNGWGGDASISCPNCDAANLHISDLRGCDDFIGRQGGYAIEFWCEGCDLRPELCIQEHKGSTYLFWREAGSKQEIRRHTLRELGCSECGQDFADRPFVHHETDGFGGPYCLRCAVEKYDFGKSDPSKHFCFHDVGEE